METYYLYLLNNAKKKSPKFNRLVSDIVEEEKALPSPHGWQGKLAHKFTIEGYENKVKSGLTGEWVIFGKEKGLNYYLCIAQHTGPGKEDRELFDFIRQSCSSEYPFLFKE